MVLPLSTENQIISADAIHPKAEAVQQMHGALISAADHSGDAVKLKLIESSIDTAVDCLEGISVSMKLAGKLVANLAGVIKWLYNIVKTDSADDLVGLSLQKDIESHRRQLES